MKTKLQIRLLAVLSLLLAALPSQAAHAPHVDFVNANNIQPQADSSASEDSKAATQADIQAALGEMPLYFIANQGHLDSRVAYYVQGSDKTLYFTSEGITIALTDLTTSTEFTQTKEGLGSAPSLLFSEERGEERGRWIVKLDFVDANSVRPSGQAQTEAVISYFKGSPDEWHTGLPTYSKIVYPNLWEGIDLVYSGTVNRLKHEFVVQPGADPALIRLAYRGATVHVNETGQLEVSTPAGGFQDDAPVAYQEVNGQRVPVSVAFALENAATPGPDEPHPYGFQVGTYNPTLPLVIDPAMLVYCGYIGGTDSNGDFGTAIAVDTAGNAYVTGYAHSTEATFPVTVGPDLTFNGVQDAFVAKVKADGTGLVYAGYIGGNSYDYGTGIAVDADGNAYITGDTESTQATFPVTVGPDLTFNSPYGYRDAFVAKVNADGTGLMYAGYIGGPGDETGYGIALDAAGNAYVTGVTTIITGYIDNFPVIVGPDLIRNGIFDAFVAKVKADGTGLVYAGYIGGSGIDFGEGIAVDSDGNAYVTGITSSTEATFPVTIGPDLTYNGGPTVSPWDGFVTKIKADGTGLVYCGYIGGAEQDYGTGIAVDAAGNAYVTGYTNSTQATFPVVIGPDLTYNGDYWDAFVTKVKADGTGYVYSGYIGGDEGDTGDGIAVDASGNAYITGGTSSTQATFPVAGGPDLTHNGYDDAFVAKVKADGTQLLYAGYIGGTSGDNAHGIAIDSAGNAYIAGDTCTSDATFPAIVGPDLTFNGTSGYDAFVAKISYTIDNTAPTVVSSLRADPNPTTATSVHFTVTFSESVTGVDKTDFSLTAPGLTGASVTTVSGSGATRTITVNTGSGHGTLRLNVVDNDTIRDGAGNPLGGKGTGNGNYTSGQKYTLDRDNQFRSAAAQDGWVLESSETSGKGGSLAATGNLRLGDDAANKQYRSLLYFNTASLPDNATITKVTLKIRKASVTGTDPFTTHGPLLADIKKGTFGASPLEIGDFQATASKTNVGHFSAVSGSTGWVQLVLGAANYPYINKSGVTQFRLRFTKDDNNDHGADYVSFYAGDATTASNQPLLIVEYTLP